MRALVVFLALALYHGCGVLLAPPLRIAPCPGVETCESEYTKFIYGSATPGWVSGEAGHFFAVSYGVFTQCEGRTAWGKPYRGHWQPAGAVEARQPAGADSKLDVRLSHHDAMPGRWG